MRRSVVLIVCLAFLLLSASAMFAQAPPAPTAPPAQKPPAAKKPSAKKAQKRRPAPVKPAPETPAARAQVADQLRLVMRFLYLYGRISVGMETAATDAAHGQSSPAAIEKNKQNQANIVQNIEGLRGGIERLEKSFGEKPETSLYLPRLSGAAATISDARDLAASGKFNEAGRMLVTAAERLIELLRDMK